MLYVKIENGKAVLAQAEYPPEGREWATANKTWLAHCDVANGSGWQTRNDWPSFERAEQVARELCAAEGGTTMFIATDSGPNVHPRFDVIRRPQVGDEVSYAFNGDSYPDGEIVKISASLRQIRTSKGNCYTRRKLSGAWVRGGTWSLIPGHHNERNPSF